MLLPHSWQVRCQEDKKPFQSISSLLNREEERASEQDGDVEGAGEEEVANEDEKGR